MRKLILASAIGVFSFNALAYKLNQIEIKTNPALVGKVRMEMELKKPWFRSAGEKTIDIDENSELVQLDKTENISAINYKIFIDSDINVGSQDTQSAILSGKLDIKGSKSKFKGSEIKGDDLDILTRHKFKADIECDNIMTSSVDGEKLIISLESFANISNCRGDDIHYYTLNGIGKRNVGAGRNHYTIDQDKQLGKEFVDEFDAENSHKILPLDHPMTIFMQKQMEKIAAVSDMPDLKPVVKVINADVLNAFALPGGYVYVFRGLLEKAPNLDAVMGVLGHEWAHVTARHGTRGMTRAKRTLMFGLGIAAVGVIGAEFIDDEKEFLKKLVAGSAVALGLGGAQLYILDRGREQELEADRIGSQYATLAGFAPTGIATMFREFKRLAPGGSTTLEKLLSSHPHHDERIDKNLILSSLFYPAVNADSDNSIMVDEELIIYEDALADLSTMPIPSIEETEETANAFVQTLHAQNEEKLLKDVREYLEKISKDEDVDAEDDTEELE